MKKIKPKFVRKEANKKAKLGKGRKKLWKWRRQKGRHNKIRQKMKGYTGRPVIGYGSKKSSRHLINNQKPRLIFNAEELSSVQKHEVAVIAHTSKKNKIKIAKKALEKNIKILNLDPKTFLEKFEKKKEEKKPEVKEKQDKPHTDKK